MTAVTGVTIYQDAAGQTYLHLPLVPTLVVVLILLALLKIKILSLGFGKKDQIYPVEMDEEVSEVETTELEESEEPEEPQHHVRRISL